MVHSFSPADAWFEDFVTFAELFGTAVGKGSIARAQTLGKVALHLGWISDSAAPAERRTPLGRSARSSSQATPRHPSPQGTQIPYMSHLMGVASLVLDDGGDEDEAIAALLHDAVEDQGGTQTLGQVRQLFGRRVADIVEACSERAQILPALCRW